MQMKQTGFLAGLRKPIEENAVKPARKRKLDPDNLSSKDVWHTRRKKGRLVVRNLPFQVTEEKLKEHFEKHGKVVETTLLKRKDGKLVGCGFVEFEKREEAKKALEECSGKPLMKRPIVVDWAVPKGIYRGIQKKEDIKEEPKDSEVKEEPDSAEEEDEKPSFDETKDEDDVSSEDESEQENSDEADSGEEYESSIDLDEDEEAGDEEEESDEEDEEEQAKRRRLNDLDEGKTVFLKCVPFSATEEDLRECVGKFGPISYALICVDPVTEHSRGTAFVKFKNKESADKCLEAGASDLRIGTTGVLDPHRALDKRSLHKKFEEKKEDKVKMDGRNLYLIKEGVVMAGSTAAKGVSAADMAYRLQLEQSKSQMLRNLSMVVSPLRLAVHNLPENYSDQALRKMFQKHAPAGAKITEARIMRDLRKVDAKGQGLSKGFAFVTFMKHSDALSALRAINNNPSIFNPKKRPIVSFSIENQALLNARQKRLEASRAKNPNFQGNRKDGAALTKKKLVEHGKHESQEADYTGIEAHRTQKIKLPNRRTLREQAEVHRRSITTEKKKVKRERKAKQLKQEKAKKKLEPKPKGKVQIVDKEEKAFDSMVNKYRNMISDKDIKKWYE
ncbi:RNA-binding protein 28 [Neocloeon triangulifer]|uniref:RNA-binding protein 28 n=1 Tax=Neocloeon triangulifer TaxID=2078957 RepID=UPI00286F4C67|nr:RNA-binding protein 28 [Neocloeon triangulifer]